MLPDSGQAVSKMLAPLMVSKFNRNAAGTCLRWDGKSVLFHMRWDGCYGPHGVTNMRSRRKRLPFCSAGAFFVLMPQLWASAPGPLSQNGSLTIDLSESVSEDVSEDVGEVAIWARPWLHSCNNFREKHLCFKQRVVALAATACHWRYGSCGSQRITWVSS
jgi:hypothetical protein